MTNLSKNPKPQFDKSRKPMGVSSSKRGFRKEAIESAVRLIEANQKLLKEMNIRIKNEASI